MAGLLLLLMPRSRPELRTLADYNVLVWDICNCRGGKGAGGGSDCGAGEGVGV